MDYVYSEGVYNYPLPTGNDNINSVRLQGTGLRGIDFEYTSTEQFDGGNTEMEIGWIEYSSCIEGANPSTLNPLFSSDELLQLAQQAVTVKILPSTDIPGHSETAYYAMMADLCSNPIFALNNGYSLSFTLDENFVPSKADPGNWIGDNVDAFLWNTCGVALYELADGKTYWACNNVEGLHITETHCWWDWQDTTGHDITVWLGFDAKKDRECMRYDDGTYAISSAAPSPAPTTQPTTGPTTNPTADPTMNAIVG